MMDVSYNWHCSMDLQSQRGSTTWLMLSMHLERDFGLQIVEYDII